MQNAKLKMKNCNLQSAFDQRAFTLVELLIAMAIASVVGMAGVSLFSTSNWAYKVNEDVAEVQQNARVSMERLSKDIRMAGFGLPDPPFTLSIGGQNWSSPITVTTSGGSGAPDSVTILGIGYEAGVLENDADNNGTEDDGTCNGGADSRICLDTVASANNFFSSDLTTFKTSRKYISLNGSTFIELSNTQIERADKKLALGTPSILDRNYPDGTPVYIIQAVTYSIVTNDAGASPPCTSANPCLRSTDLTEFRGIGSQTLAENIEDIQFAYGLDGTIGPTFTKDGKVDDKDNDGVIEDTDYRFSVAGDAAITDPTGIIAVRATVVAKARNKDMRGSTFTRPAIEDRSVGAPDNYRRRILTKIIKLRNPRTGG